MQENEKKMESGIRGLYKMKAKSTKPVAILAIVFCGISIATATLFLVGFILAANFSNWSLDLKNPLFIAGAVSWLLTHLTAAILSVIVAVMATKYSFKRASDILILGAVLMAVVLVILPFLANVSGYILCIIGSSNYLYHLRHKTEEEDLKLN